MTVLPALGGKGRRSAARPAAVGVGSIGSPVALSLAHHSDLAIVLGATEMTLAVVFAGVLYFAILFGSPMRCERAFRLLRWMRDKPEPESAPISGAPPASP